MPTNNHAQIRYLTLDKCFSNQCKKYYIDDLIEACNMALHDFDPKATGVKRRQIFDDIRFMESKEGWQIPLERIRVGKKLYYRYSDPDFTINDKPLTDTEFAQLQQTIALLDRFKGMAGFDWMDEMLMQLRWRFSLRGDDRKIIDFGQNPKLMGLQFLSPIFDAILHKQVLHIDYESFKRGLLSWDIHPYFLKQYNNRWFLFGLDDDRHNIVNIAIDRITNITKVDDKHYIPNHTIDFEHYFDNIIGVTFEKGDLKVETIRLKFTESRFPYVVSKPIHHSQIVTDNEQHIVELRVIPNKELLALILSYGDDVEVLSPASLKAAIATKIENLHKKYFAVH